MLRYLADEDFDNRILRAFRRNEPTLDWVRVQNVGLSGSSDERVIQFAVESNRIILSRDVSTMTAAAYNRIERSEPMLGVIIVPQRQSLAQSIDELLFLAKESEPSEWVGQVIYLPL